MRQTGRSDLNEDVVDLVFDEIGKYIDTSFASETSRLQLTEVANVYARMHQHLSSLCPNEVLQGLPATLERMVPHLEQYLRHQVMDVIDVARQQLVNQLYRNARQRLTSTYDLAASKHGKGLFNIMIADMNRGFEQVIPTLIEAVTRTARDAHATEIERLLGRVIPTVRLWAKGVPTTAPEIAALVRDLRSARETVAKPQGEESLFQCIVCHRPVSEAAVAFACTAKEGKRKRSPDILCVADSGCAAEWLAGRAKPLCPKHGDHMARGMPLFHVEDKLTILRECNTCYESLPRKFFVPSSECHHTSCILCVARVITDRIHSRATSSFPIRCMVPTCDAALSGNVLAVLVDVCTAATREGLEFPGNTLLSSEILDTFEQWAYTQAIPVHQLFYCPVEECGELMELHRTVGAYRELDMQPTEKCASCHTPVCVACGTVAHSPISCDENMERIAAQAWMLDNHAKQCPACGISILHYRDHGCHHIMPGSGCPNCSHHFCYACLGPFPCKQCSLFCNDQCGCPACPDCAPGARCSACSGCHVCCPS